MDYQTYTESFVQISGRSAVCLLCPCTVSCQELMDVENAQLKSHFTKLHVQKKGFYYCGICCKSVCPVTQPDQLQIHKDSTVHKQKKNRTGYEFSVCNDCCTVNPVKGHNKAHHVEQRQYIVLDEEILDGAAEGGEEPQQTVSVGLSAAHCAEIYMGIITQKDDKLIQGKALCNEHFEKMFRGGWGKTGLVFTQGKEAKCYCCKKLHSIWQEVPVRMGKQVMIEETVFRKYAVPYFAAGITAEFKLPLSVSMQEYISMSATEQDLYDFDPNRKCFVRKAAAKKLLTAQFMTTGAVEGLRTVDSDDEEQLD